MGGWVGGWGGGRQCAHGHAGRGLSIAHPITPWAAARRTHSTPPPPLFLLKVCSLIVLCEGLRHNLQSHIPGVGRIHHPDVAAVQGGGDGEHCVSPRLAGRRRARGERRRRRSCCCCQPSLLLLPSVSRLGRLTSWRASVGGCVSELLPMCRPCSSTHPARSLAVIKATLEDGQGGGQGSAGARIRVGGEAARS